MGVVHITVSLEAAIETEIRQQERARALLVTPIDPVAYASYTGYLRALRWVLAQARAELDA